MCSGREFKSYEELVENISRSGEVEFLYNGQDYSVLPIPEGIVVLEQYNEDSEIIYDNPEAVGNYLIDGEYLKDVITKAEITFRCF